MKTPSAPLAGLFVLVLIGLLYTVVSSPFRIDKLEKRVEAIEHQRIVTKDPTMPDFGKGFITIHEDEIGTALCNPCPPGQTIPTPTPGPVYGKMTCSTSSASDGHIDWYECKQSVTRNGEEYTHTAGVEETKP